MNSPHHRKKKTKSEVGTILTHVKDLAILRPWADYMAGTEPWKSLGMSADRLHAEWSENPQLQFYTATAPKRGDLQTAHDISDDYGLIVFTVSEGKKIIEAQTNKTLPSSFEDGGYIRNVVTKARRKGVAQNLLSTAERVISEKNQRTYLFVSKTNQAAQKFYKSIGYEEINQIDNVLKDGNVEILMTKRLS